MIVKREGYPDITDDDLKPITEIEFEVTPINPVRHERKGPNPIVLPDLIAYLNPRGKYIKTTIVGDQDDNDRGMGADLPKQELER